MEAAGRVRRLADVADPALQGARFDYADCFEVTTDPSAARSPEALARAALEGMPAALRWLVLSTHRFVLRLELAPRSAPDQVLGWRIVESTPEHLVLEADGPLLRGLIVGRQTGPGVAVVRTFVFHHRPSARVVWSAVSPLHRWVAPLLLHRAASAASAP